jgi:hypothetical protein
MASFNNGAADGQPDELDLTPYEEDDDETLHRKLVAAKMARKRAEEDLKLLCNRIGLLKHEEGRVSFIFHKALGRQKNRRNSQTCFRYRDAASPQYGAAALEAVETAVRNARNRKQNEHAQVHEGGEQ